MSKLQASIKSQNTKNPIRNIVDNLKRPMDHPSPFINLGLGDPTIHGNLPRPDGLTNIIKDVLMTSANDGYGPSTGLVAAREAIANSLEDQGYSVSPDNVVIGSGCSGALELVVSVLVNPGDNILIPNPGFALYQVLTEAIGGEVRKYNLKPEANWECDLAQMESLINDRTKAILINNPSNPCGSNFSREHLVQVAALAKKYNLPVIADEIYAGVVFNGTFTAIHEVTTEIPIFSVGGIAKEFVVPGWRVGWVVVHDRTEGSVASEVIGGLKSLSQLILGANSIVQACLPRLLSQDPSSPDFDTLKTYNTKYCEILRVNAELCCTEVARCNRALATVTNNTADVLSISKPAGAMYAMIGIDMTQLDTIHDDAEFARLLLHEENVSVLPGICFGMKDYVRFVICPSDTILQDAFNRLLSFCTRHLQSNAGALSSPMKNLQG